MATLRRRELTGALILVGAFVGKAYGQDAQWLVGTWRGSIIGLAGNNSRTLRVRSVAPDGSVAANWGGEDVQGTFRNGELSLRTGPGNPVTLTRTAPGTLSGTFVTAQGTGRRYSVLLERQQ